MAADAWRPSHLFSVAFGPARLHFALGDYMIWLTKFLDSFRKPAPATARAKRVIKRYHFLLRFEPGNATVTDPLSIESMRQAVWRAKIIPEHRIEVETHEDPADPQEVGMAVRRLEVLREFLLENSVPEERLEMRVHPVNCCGAKPGEFARVGAIRLFPRVASLGSGVGEVLLSYKEVALLQSARETVLFPKDHDLGEFARKCGQVDWKRIVGYESLPEWVSAGASHPVYDHL